MTVRTFGAMVVVPSDTVILRSQPGSYTLPTKLFVVEITPADVFEKNKIFIITDYIIKDTIIVFHSTENFFIELHCTMFFSLYVQIFLFSIPFIKQL